MGITRFSGPVYGAKGLLWSGGPKTLSTNASTTAVLNGNRVIPSYEDWFITEVWAACSTCSSAGNNFILKSEGGSTTGIPRVSGQFASTVAQTITTFNPLTSTTMNTMNTVTGTPGEYEGLYVPAGSTMRWVSSGVNPQANFEFQVMGYIRYIDSTRSA